MNNILAVSLAIVSVVILFLGMLVVYLQAVFVKGLREEYNRLTRELRNVFGWDDCDWDTKFKKYSREATDANEKINKIMKLAIIKKAFEVQELENLQAEKETLDRKIERLQK